METTVANKSKKESQPSVAEKRSVARHSTELATEAPVRLSLFLQRQVELEEEDEVQPKLQASLIQRQTQEDEEEEEEETVQAKLTVGRADDQYEREADEVADSIMRMPFREVQRQSIEEEEEELVQAKFSTPRFLQRFPESGSAGFSSRLNGLKGGGQPLPDNSRSFFETRFNRDFQQVRIHDDTESDRLARSINARAFTFGSDIAFRAGHYQPDSQSGKSLLAHELTHVVQQNPDSTIQRTPDHYDVVQLSPLSDELERIWNTGDKGAFFTRLRQVAVSDADLTLFVELELVGDDYWLASNILTYGPESVWPIHLRVEREMKGWGDSGGKGVVFDILRAADGSEAWNLDLLVSLQTVFAGQPDDLWLSENLVMYGREINWPIHLRVEREMKGWGDCGGKAAVFDILRVADGAEAGNTELTTTLNAEFAGQPDDLWLSGHLQQHGREVNWPIHLRVDREMKGWSDCHGEAGVYDILRAANGAEAGNANLRASLDRIFSGRTEERWYANFLQEHGGAEQHAGVQQPTAAMISGLRRELFPTSTSAGGAVLQWDGGSLSTLTPAAKTRARTDLVTRVTRAITSHLNRVMPQVRRVAARPRLPISDFQGAGNAAKGVVDERFGNYARAAAPTPSQPTGRTEFQLRTSNPGQTLFDAYEPSQRTAAGSGIWPEDLARWIANNDSAAKAAQRRHNFNPSRPGSTEERDFLWNQIVVPFCANVTNYNNLWLYDQFGFAISTERGIVLGTSVIPGLSTTPATGGGPSIADRVTKWEGWKTLVHEYLHRLEHSAFHAAARGNPILIEGFCEMFTKEVLLDVIPGAPSNSTLITQIEGGVYTPSTTANIVGRYRTSRAYRSNLRHAENIRDRIIGASRGGEHAVKAAFFQGHVELIGLTPVGAMISPAPGGANRVSVPGGVTTLAQLASASGLSEGEITSANSGLTATSPLPAHVNLPGCREHIVVESIDPATRVRTAESKGRIAIQNGVTPLDLERANPSVTWTTLAAGQRILIPRH